jgi:hypothetical protein
MANLPSQYPHLALHLTDRALTPLITSARGQQRLQSLTALSHTALNAHESALRLGLGMPQRVMVEHGEGPVFLQTFMSPQPAPVAPSLPHDDQTRPSAPDTGNMSAAIAQLASLSVSSANGATQHSQAPAQNPQPQTQQQQGALALAAESRGTAQSGPAPTTSAYLRGAVATDDEHEHSAFLGGEHDIDNEENSDAPPMLVGIVVGPSSDDTLEARRAAARLERVGREIQGRWAELQGQNPGSGRSDERQGDGAGV